MLFIKESSDALLHQIKIDSQEEIILNGTPSNMSGFLQLSNGLDEAVKIRSVALKEKTSAKEKTELNISWKLLPRESKLQPINVAIAADTPPGEYIRYLEIGGGMRKVTMVVQPNIEIDVHPTHFTLQNSAPGAAQSVAFTMTNTGNMPFQIPEVKHIAALDMDLMCRAFGFAFRDAASNGFTATLDAVAENIKKNLTDWATTRVREAGQIVAPGKSVLIHLDFQIPKNSDSQNDYSGNIRFWDKELTFVIKAHSQVSTKRKTS